MVITIKKTYIRPLFTPDNVYVFRFGKKHLNNRLIVRYGHKWTGRQKKSMKLI